jgi:hypothetical protein
VAGEAGTRGLSDLVVYRRSDFDEDRSVPNTLAYSTRLDGVLVYER